MTRLFLEKGHTVIATSRRQHDSPGVQLLHETYPSNLLLHTLDVTSDASVNTALKDLSCEVSSIDILINNAGIYPEGGDESLEELPLDQFQSAMEVNYLGTIRVTKAFLPHLKKGKDARIINLSSGAATLTEKDDSRRYCYGPSKTALNMFTRTLACELRPLGIPVVAISPGWVRTDMGGSDADLGIEESAEAIVETITHLTMDLTGEFLDRFGKTGVYKW